MNDAKSQMKPYREFWITEFQDDNGLFFLQANRHEQVDRGQFICHVVEMSALTQAYEDIETYAKAMEDAKAEIAELKKLAGFVQGGPPNQIPLLNMELKEWKAQAHKLAEALDVASKALLRVWTHQFYREDSEGKDLRVLCGNALAEIRKLKGNKSQSSVDAYNILKELGIKLD